VLTREQEEAKEQAEKRLGELREGYKKYRTEYQLAQSHLLDWENKVPRPPDYIPELQRRKAAMDNAYQDWVDLGNKEEYETQLAIKRHLESN
jgi:hypothetical protein